MGANPIRQPLQPEAIGAVMEVTKWLKPSISVSQIGDSASVQAATHRVLVTVTDSGVGIFAENAGQLFNAFFTTKSNGMGMGLSICRSIMEAHGGRLWATANVPRFSSPRR
jgi:signal transduction histidine kinase